ncbi:MAG: hypothetical protein ACRBBK_08375 [Paracoccaceae bacterium]|jgi:hypothetical protein
MSSTANDKRRLARRLMIIGAGLLLLGVGAFFTGLNLGWEASDGSSRQGLKFALLQAGGAGFGFGLASLMLGLLLWLGARRAAGKP